MFSQKALLGLTAGVGMACSVGATGTGCPGYPDIKNPTPKTTATATATPVVTKLASGAYTVSALPGPYATGFPSTFTTAFTPLAGKAVTVTAKADRSADFLSIEVSPSKAGTLAAGSGLFSTKGPSTSNTATLKLTPPDAGALNVYVGDYTGWGGQPTASVTVTVTQAQ